MSVSLREVIEAGGYDLSTLEDANWLLAKQNEFEELIEKAEKIVEKEEQRLYDEAEAEYQKTFGDHYIGEDRGGADFTED